ncbi:MAG TPA: MFS transporter [Ktedonobacteraceae bacterium]|nr:MFS transporter [Ktedonobacteraceae bacterium]
MSLVPGTPEQELTPVTSQKCNPLLAFTRLPFNVYLLLCFTLGKGFQLSISTLTVNYYAHSLGYRPDFIGLLSAMPAIGSLVSAVPLGMLADRIGRKKVLIATAILTPLFLAGIGLGTSAPWLLSCAFMQGIVSNAYWVTNLPLLTESTTESQRVGVFALNSFLLLGVGALGNLLGGAIPEFVGHVLHVSAGSPVPLRWGVLTAASSTFIFGLPLWFLREPKRERAIKNEEAAHGAQSSAPTKAAPRKERLPVMLFARLLIPDLLFSMGEGAVVALIQLYFVLRFHLLPGTLGIIFTISGLAGGIFALTAPLFVHRWSKLRIITTVMYLSCPLMILVGFAPTLLLAVGGEYTRSFMRTLIEPVYAAFEMEQVSDRFRATLSGFYSVTWSIGYSIGPTIAGWLQTNVNLSTAFVFGACCLATSASLLLLFFGRKAKSDPFG